MGQHSLGWSLFSLPCYQEHGKNIVLEHDIPKQCRLSKQCEDWKTIGSNNTSQRISDFIKQLLSCSSFSLLSVQQSEMEFVRSLVKRASTSKVLPPLSSPLGVSSCGQLVIYICMCLLRYGLACGSWLVQGSGLIRSLSLSLSHCPLNLIVELWFSTPAPSMPVTALRSSTCSATALDLSGATYDLKQDSRPTQCLAFEYFNVL